MIVLDTHVVVWLLSDSALLSGKARDTILQARIDREALGYSVVTIYEISYAARRNRLPLASSVGEFVAAIESKLVGIQLTSDIAQCAAALPEPFHGDPMDRIIAATAIAQDCMLITCDERMRSANVCKTIW
jgi:PIN domain nuclease of toxin-antitoxin system